MFSIVVIAVAIGVFAMYFRHERQMRRKRRAELASGAPNSAQGRNNGADSPSEKPW